jgi:hypothetical protein
MTLNDLVLAARLHAENLAADINNAGNRLEHIRLTRLALEAKKLADDLETWNGEV